MKAELNPKTVGIAIAAVVVAVIAVAMLYFKSSASAGPPLTPKPWHPPGNWAGAPGKGGMGAGSPGDVTKSSPSTGSNGK